MKFQYYNPVYVDFGVGVLNQLSSYIKNRKALLVTSNGFVKRGYVNTIKAKVHSIVRIVSDITPNPEIQLLADVYNSLKHEEFDVIVALGGGSVIDSAKVLSVHCKEYGNSFDYVNDIIRGKSLVHGYKLKPIIAIPTTAGTGSELTPWATVWDMVEKKKYSLHLPNLFPEVALCDPELTLTVPKDITIQTALDTLSHALESIWNKNASPITIQFAISSAKTIIDKLPILIDKLDDLNLRSEIMLACINAGKAFSNTATSTAHAISYYITAHKGVPHGIACSITLARIVDTLIGQDQKLDNIFCTIFGDLSSNSLNRLFHKVNISCDLSSYGIDGNDIKLIKKSLSSNIRAKNGILDIDMLFANMLDK